MQSVLFKIKIALGALFILLIVPMIHIGMTVYGIEELVARSEEQLMFLEHDMVKRMKEAKKIECGWKNALEGRIRSGDILSIEEEIYHLSDRVLSPYILDNEYTHIRRFLDIGIYPDEGIRKLYDKSDELGALRRKDGRFSEFLKAKCKELGYTGHYYLKESYWSSYREELLQLLETSVREVAAIVDEIEKTNQLWKKIFNALLYILVPGGFCYLLLLVDLIRGRLRK